MKLRLEEPGGVRIEMFPLIDSFFLILVYFVYTFLSLSAHQGIELNLPRSTTAVEQREEHHGISVTREGEVFFDQAPVTLEALPERLRGAASASAEPAFYVYGDENAPHGTVVQILDVFRREKIEKVYIQTNPYEELR